MNDKERKSGKPGYVYIMYDTEQWEKATPLYIGKTKGLKSRMYSHFHTLQNGKMSKDEYESIKIIRVAELPTYTDAGIIERYLVGMLHPSCNTQMVKEGKPTIAIDMSVAAFETFAKEDFLPKERRCSRAKGSLGGGENKTSRYLKYLERCFLIEHNGWSHILYYPRSMKEIAFVDETEWDFFQEAREDVTLLPLTLSDAFDQTVKRLGIPTTLDYPLSYLKAYNTLIRESSESERQLLERKGYKEIAVNLNSFINHPEIDRLYGIPKDSEVALLRKEIIDYRESYSGIRFEPFYAVHLHNKTGASFGARNFSSLDEAKEYADQISTSFCHEHKVMYITSTTVETLYVAKPVRDCENCGLCTVVKKQKTE